MSQRSVLSHFLLVVVLYCYGIGMVAVLAGVLYVCDPIMLSGTMDGHRNRFCRWMGVF